MKTLRFFVLTLALLAITPILLAQDYDYYLQQARQFIAEGDCSWAEASYKTYKEMAEKTNKEIEQLIEECKDGGSSAREGNLTFTVNGVSFAMKYVEGGTYWMGAQSENPNGQFYDYYANSSEQPHIVMVSTFYMGETEVTQALWTAVMGENPSNCRGDDLPVERVSWNDCLEFIHKLNQITGKNFRLPTEAEWEYAAHGGNMSKGYYYSGGNDVDKVAWYSYNSDFLTHSVKTKQPNELGLYDMSGNVWEWCSDWYGNYSKSSQVNPQGPSVGNWRVLRSSSIASSPGACRIRNRDFGSPYEKDSRYGLRLCLPANSGKGI